MTWSGNMKREAGRQRRQRYNSSSSRNSTPSPKTLEDRTSPIGYDMATGGMLRLSPPARPADSCSVTSRSPSPEGDAYAGARFSEPPAPELLPKPPSHWMNFGTVEPVQSSCSDMASQLKNILRVAAQQA